MKTVRILGIIVILALIGGALKDVPKPIPNWFCLPTLIRCLYR